MSLMFVFVAVAVEVAGNYSLTMQTPASFQCQCRRLWLLFWLLLLLTETATFGGDYSLVVQTAGGDHPSSLLPPWSPLLSVWAVVVVVAVAVAVVVWDAQHDCFLVVQAADEGISSTCCPAFPLQTVVGVAVGGGGGCCCRCCCLGCST